MKIKNGIGLGIFFCLVYLKPALGQDYEIYDPATPLLIEELDLEINQQELLYDLTPQDPKFNIDFPNSLLFEVPETDPAEVYELALPIGPVSQLPIVMPTLPLDPAQEPDDNQ